MNFVNETDKRFYIAPSKLPQAGHGCFTKEKMLKGDYLEIIGVQVEYASLEDKCSHFGNRYKFAAEPEKQLKHVILPLGYAAMVNQANRPEDQNVAIAHLPVNRQVRNPAAGQAVYMAIRDIEPDEELLANYNRK